MKYKYTTTFQADIQLNQLNDFFVSKASLDELSSLIPDNIDFDKNVDLLGVSFNAAVVNMFNKNGDGISTDTAIAYADQFVHKPTNIEHNRDKVVGHIVSAGYSDYATSALLTEDEARYSDKPFNIALAAVVYKSINPEFADLLEKAADPNNEEFYQKVSTSWEVGFTDYIIAVGSSNLNECRIVENGDELDTLNACLKSNGGSGRTSGGKHVHRLITGEIYPLGIGFTGDPAADVSGVFIKEKGNLNNNPSDNISQNNKNNVKKGKNIDMDIEKLVSELKDLLGEKEFSKEAVASMTNSFTDAIRQSDEKYRQDLDAVKVEKEAAEKESLAFQASIAEIEKALEDANSRIATFENEKLADEAVARFNVRMDELDSKFELESEDREFLADEVKGLGESDEAFASFTARLDVLWKHKNKESKEAFEAEIQARIEAEVAKRTGKSPDPVNVEEVLDNAKQVDPDISNVNEASASKENQTFAEKFKGAFSRENVEISQ